MVHDHGWPRPFQQKILLRRLPHAGLSRAQGEAVMAQGVAGLTGTICALAKAGVERGENGSILPRPTPPLLRLDGVSFTASSPCTCSSRNPTCLRPSDNRPRFWLVK